MANENTARDRTNDPASRGSAKAVPASDPLAELARLIGRSELLSQSSREARSAAKPVDAVAASDDPMGAAEPYAEPESAPLYSTETPAHELRSDTDAPDVHQDWPGSPPPAIPDLLSEMSAPAPSYSPPPAQQYEDPGYAGANPGSSYPGSAYPGSSFPNTAFSDADSPFSSPAPHATSSSGFAGTEIPSSDFPSTNFPDPSFQSQGYPSSSSANVPGSGFASSGFSDFPNRELPRSNFQASTYSDAPRSASALRSDIRSNEPPDLPAFVLPGYAAASDRQDLDPPFLADADPSGMPPPHDDDFYDDEPRSGRRRGLRTVVAVLALAVLGTAGAFGYRTMVSGTRTAAAPPVIRASTEPNKVAPPPSAPDASASKFSYDRFGDAGKDEKVLKREEKPVDLAKVAPPPPPPAPANTSTVTQSSANPPSAIGEPRRVRTVPIRPDQGGDAATAAPAQQPSSVMTRQSNASAAQASRTNSRVASRPPAPAANAPLSLSPDANNAPAAPPEPQARALPPTAPAPPPAPRAAAPPPAPARVASAPAQAPVQTSAIGGGFMVQVSSQRSQADAESAYRGIQSKYSSVLANQPHQVRRADLGAKGTYYRAMVGPFGTREAAVQLCVNLKQAGGDCVVQH
jgi:hypothetical protein